MEQDSASEQEGTNSEKADSKGFSSSLRVGFIDGMLERTSADSGKEVFETIGREVGRRLGRRIGRAIGQVLNNRTDATDKQSAVSSAGSETFTNATDPENEDHESTENEPTESEAQQENASN